MLVARHFVPAVMTKRSITDFLSIESGNVVMFASCLILSGRLDHLNLVFAVLIDLLFPSLGMKDSWGPLKALAAATVINGVGDILLCSLLGYGIAGAAWATTVSQVCNLRNMLCSCLCILNVWKVISELICTHLSTHLIGCCWLYDDWISKEKKI